MIKTNHKKLNKTNKRQQERNRLSFDVNHHFHLVNSQRRTLSDQEKRDFVYHIKHNVTAQFGLAKLIQLNLNELLSISVCLDSNTRCTGNNNREDETQCLGTLLAYSSVLKRDKITHSLLRAGADPTIPLQPLLHTPSLDATQHASFSSVPTQQLQLFHHLSAYPPALAVFLVNLSYQRINITTPIITDNTHNDPSTDSLTNTLTDKPFPYFTRHPCDHTITYADYWQEVLDSSCAYEDMLCSVCLCPLAMLTPCSNSHVIDYGSGSGVSHLDGVGKEETFLTPCEIAIRL